MHNGAPTCAMLVAMSSDKPTVPAPPPAPATGTRVWLVVMTDDKLETHALPARGRVTIGRDAACEIRVDHASVSRTHAALTIDPLAITDLGGTNGTHVAGARLARDRATPLRTGEIFHVGTVALVVQQAAAVEAPAPREDLIVADDAMRELHATIARVAAGDISVLVLGETGVGK
ncbi:MAG TPA: FHA domain-containing protein, partial [Kofleriaceae bacterium]|nr:FHA domain-containing protein [Kofleriaceae bacterium]